MLGERRHGSGLQGPPSAARPRGRPQLIRKERLTIAGRSAAQTRDPAAAALDHPNIVRLRRRRGGRRPLFTMEYVEGTDLARLVTHGPCRWPTPANTSAHGGAGLAARSRKGMVHRDIKPRQLAPRYRGDSVRSSTWGWRALEDFSRRGPAHRAPGSVVDGPDAYFSWGRDRHPRLHRAEQAINSHLADIRAACTAWVFLLLPAGLHGPFTVGTTLETLFKHRMEEPLPWSTYAAGVAGIGRGVRKLIPNADDRYRLPTTLSICLGEILARAGVRGLRVRCAALGDRALLPNRRFPLPGFQRHRRTVSTPPELAQAAETALAAAQRRRRRGPAGAGGPARGQSSFARARRARGTHSRRGPPAPSWTVAWPMVNDPDMTLTSCAASSAFRLRSRGTLPGVTCAKS